MMNLTAAEAKTLQALEEELWRAETRFDRARMEELLAPDFFEFGRSGRTYTRAETLAMAAEPIDAQLPLPNFQARLLTSDVAQVTYDSAVTYNGTVYLAHRSSIWTRRADGWQLRFHQGTPLRL